LDRSQIGTKPIEYVTGVAEFCGYPFHVSPAVLIPRLETEELVAHLATQIEKRWLSTSLRVTVREIGTGSGAVSIALFLELLSRKLPPSMIKLTLSDVSPAALAIAQKNIATLVPAPFQPQISICESDLLTDSIATVSSQTYDFIVANLPYIPTKRIRHLDASVKDHEPLIALDGGTDGFALIAQLLMPAPQRLTPQGEIWLEVDHTHTLEFLTQQYPEVIKMYSWQDYSDSLGNHRFLRAIQKKTV
jgi:release factor glutamine methyltransferase